MSKLKTFVAPWAEIAYLRRELRGARSSCSAEAKRGNRLVDRIETLNRALVRRKQQIRSDQAYINALESRLDQSSIAGARAESRDAA